MIDDQYLIVTTHSGKLVCSGKLINHKYDLANKRYLYSIDNKYFFPKWSDHLIARLSKESIAYYEFVPSQFSDLVVLPWKDRYQSADVYIENTIFELDEEIKDLVNALINTGYETKGSCSGHHEGPSWISVAFYNLEQLIKFCSLIRMHFKKDEVNLEVPSEYSHDSIFILNLTIPMLDNKINQPMITKLTEFFSALS